MEATDIIKNLRDALNEIARKGRHFVHIPALNSYLDALERGVGNSGEPRRLQQESNFEWDKIARAAERETFRSVIQAGQTALRTVILINGGAAVALMIFLGNIWADTEPPAHILNSLLAFSAGVLWGGLATGTTYLSRTLFASRLRFMGYVFNVLTMMLVIAAYLGFAWGAYNAYLSFGNYGASYTSV